MTRALLRRHFGRQTTAELRRDARRVFVCLLAVSCCVSFAYGQWIDDVSALAVDYYRARDVKSVTVFGCWGSGERFAFFRTMNQAGMMVQFFQLETGRGNLAEVTPNLFTKGGMLVDARCENVVTAMCQMDTDFNRLLLGNLFWLFVDRSNEADENDERLRRLYKDRLRSLETLPYTNVVLGMRNVGVARWTLVEMLKPHRHANLVAETIVDGFEPERDGEVGLRRSLTVFARRNARGHRNLQGFSMPCGTATTSPEYFRGMDDRDDVHDLFTKANFPFIRELMFDLNFTLNMVQVDKVGYKHNGTFSGVMGMFQNRSIELGCLGTLMRTERLEVVDFMVVTLIIRSSIIFRQPPLSLVSNIFELPFSIGVWVCCFALMTVYWLTMMGIHFLDGVERFSALESLIYLIGIMCQRGYELVPHFNGTRLLVFSFQLTSFFIATSYSASIVALLQSPSRAILTVGDLVRSPLRAGVMDTSYGRVYYLETQDPDVQELYRRKIRPQGERAFIEPEEGIARVKQELYAFEAEVNAAYKAIKETFAPEEVCKLHELEAIKLPPFGIPIVKGSKYRELIRQRLQWQREVGIIKRFNTIWIHQKPQCENSNGGFSSVGWIEMRYSYWYLVVGFLSALVLLAAERCWHRQGLTWRSRSSMSTAKVGGIH